MCISTRSLLGCVNTSCFLNSVLGTVIPPGQTRNHYWLAPAIKQYTLPHAIRAYLQRTEGYGAHSHKRMAVSRIHEHSDKVGPPGGVRIRTR